MKNKEATNIHINMYVKLSINLLFFLSFGVSLKLASIYPLVVIPSFPLLYSSGSSHCWSILRSISKQVFWAWTPFNKLCTHDKIYAVKGCPIVCVPDRVMQVIAADQAIIIGHPVLSHWLMAQSIYPLNYAVIISLAHNLSCGNNQPWLVQIIRINLYSSVCGCARGSNVGHIVSTLITSWLDQIILTWD